MSTSETPFSASRKLSERLTMESFAAATIEEKFATIAYLLRQIKRNSGKSAGEDHKRAIPVEEFSPPYEKLFTFSRSIRLSRDFKEAARKTVEITLDRTRKDPFLLPILHAWETRDDESMLKAAKRISLHNVRAWVHETRLPYHMPEIKVCNLRNDFGHARRQQSGKHPVLIVINRKEEYCGDLLEFCDTVMHENIHARGMELASFYNQFHGFPLGPLMQDARTFAAAEAKSAMIPTRFFDAYKNQFDEEVCYGYGHEFKLGIKKLMEPVVTHHNPRFLSPAQ